MTTTWDDTLADRYAAYARDYPTYAQAAHTLLDAADLGPGARVLDLGCGTGVSTRLAASRVGPDGRVVGIDSSEAMLRRAREGSGRGTAYVCSKAEDVAAVTSGPYDAFVANMSMWQFDCDRVLDGLRLLAAPRARLAFTDGHWRRGRESCRPRESAAGWVPTLRERGWTVTRLVHADHTSTPASLETWSRLGLADAQAGPAAGAGTEGDDAVRLCVLALVGHPPQRRDQA